MTHLTRLYGLTIKSDIPFHQDRVVSPDASIDLEIVTAGSVAPTDEIPIGRVMLHLRSERQLYIATVQDDGYLLRFFGTCDIAINRELSRATVAPVEGSDPAVIPVLVSGTLLAFILTVQGAPILHGSAVQVGDAVLAFVGASGMGKSTMATLMSADGARLVTDDILRLDLSAKPPMCSLGATELRLRKAAGDLAARFKEMPRRRLTGDERDALSIGAIGDDSAPLAAIVVPLPDKSSDRTEPVIERLSAMDAFLMLSRFPRLLGWEDEEVLRNQFQQLGDIVDQVPVYLAVLPWGPPFAPDLAGSVRRAVGLA